MLGNAIFPYFSSRFEVVHASDKDVSEPWLEELDVRHPGALRRKFSELRPDIVLHLAACTDLEFCENQPGVAEETNATATGDVAALCEESGATLVYISTAGVFDGTKDGLYTEQDQPKPIMVYGQTKYDGEKLVAARCGKHFIVRAGWMVGGGANKDKKFVHRVLGQMVAGAKVIHAVNDRWGTPTYTHDFALNLFKLLDSRRYGTYHMVCEGSGTRYDVARAILDISGRDDIELVAVDSAFFGESFFAPRPVSEMMVNANLRALGMNHMRPWREALEDYIKREFTHALAGAQPKAQRRSRPDRRKRDYEWRTGERRKSTARRSSDRNVGTLQDAVTVTPRPNVDAAPRLAGVLARPRMTTLIVNWNSWHHLGPCLASLYASALRDMEVVVVDNASVDGSLAKLERLYPAVRVIRNVENVGHARAVNQGFRAALGELVLVLDVDTEAAPDAIVRLVRFLDERPDVGVAVPRTYNSDGTIQETARNFPDPINALFGRQSVLSRLLPNNRYTRRYLQRDGLNSIEPYQVESVAASCILLRKSLIERLGEWDEGYLGYFVDTDWCYRLKSAGVKIFCIPAAHVVHHENNSRRRKKSPRRIWIFHQGAMRFYRKNRTLGWADPRSALASIALTARAAVLIAANSLKTDAAPAPPSGMRSGGNGLERQ